MPAAVRSRPYWAIERYRAIERAALKNGSLCGVRPRLGRYVAYALGKSRLVPFGPQMMVLLREYLHHSGAHRGPLPPEAPGVLVPPPARVVPERIIAGIKALGVDLSNWGG